MQPTGQNIIILNEQKLKGATESQRPFSCELIQRCCGRDDIVPIWKKNKETKAKINGGPNSNEVHFCLLFPLLLSFLP